MAVVHVAVGVILNSSGQILIARRPPEAHQGGLWEFPGGKVETGETLETALRRELREELGIEIGESYRLLQVRHDYDDKQVLLDVCVVSVFSGDPRGLEGQLVQWVSAEDLERYDFPRANRAIVDAVKSL